MKLVDLKWMGCLVLFWTGMGYTLMTLFTSVIMRFVMGRLAREEAILAVHYDEKQGSRLDDINA